MNKSMKKLVGMILSILSITSAKNLQAMKKNCEKEINSSDNNHIEFNINYISDVINELKCCSVNSEAWYNVLKSNLTSADDVANVELPKSGCKIEYFMVKSGGVPIILIAASHDSTTMKPVKTCEICLYVTSSPLSKVSESEQKKIRGQIIEYINSNYISLGKIESYYIDGEKKLAKDTNASASLITNINSTQAMTKYDIKDLDNISGNEIENNNEIVDMYNDDHLGPGKNSFIQRSTSSEEVNDKSRYKNLLFEQVDEFTVSSNDDDEIIYNNDYNRALKINDFEKNKEEYKNWKQEEVGEYVIVSRDNGTAAEGYFPKPDKPEFTLEEAKERLERIEQLEKCGYTTSQHNAYGENLIDNNPIPYGNIMDNTGFHYNNLKINQKEESAVDNNFLPEYPALDETVEYENNFDNTDLPRYAQVIKIPNVEEDAYVKYCPMTSKNFKEQLEKYNKNHNSVVSSLVDLENNPNFTVGYYSIDLSEYPNPIPVCFVARIYKSKYKSWTNYIFHDSDKINEILYSFGKNDFIKEAIRNEINRLSRFDSQKIEFYNLDMEGIAFLRSEKLD